MGRCNSQMDKLFFLTLSLTRGGAERVLCNMCNEHFADRYEVTIISLMAAKPEYPLDERIRFLTLDQKEEEYQQNMAVRFLRRRRALAKCLDSLCVDGAPKALISFLPEPNMLICSLSGRCDYPIIISVRNDPVKEYGARVRNLLMRKLYPRADKYVFQTQMARDYFAFSEHILANSYVIPNPLNREFLDVEPCTKRTRECVAVGRLEDQKDPFLLLRTFDRLHRELPDVSLSFYGEGSLHEQLQTEIEQRGLGDCVFLRGNTRDVRDAIKDAALYVLCSKYEGMPNALMEAMALGLPCVATDCPCGGPAFLIDDGVNGRLVPAGDEEELFQAMYSVLTASHLAEEMGRNARGIVDRLNPDMIYDEWERLL